MNTNIIYNQDCLEAMKTMPDNSIDNITTDPPYGYSFMGKSWDTFNEVVSPGGAYENKKGFTKLPRNKPNGMYEFMLPIWTESLRVLKPGAFAFVMCAPRQDVLSKQICALTDAGFNTSFSSIYWTYSSGFPKAHNIGKTVDKKNGVEREVIGENIWSCDRKGCSDYIVTKNAGIYSGRRYNTKGNSPLEGSYGGFQPKPAVEIIIVAMKPIEEKTFVAQALSNGKGVTWLDDGRIPYNTPDNRIRNYTSKDPFNQILVDDTPKGYGKPTTGFGDRPGGAGGFGGKDNEYTVSPLGRFPANLLVSDDVLGIDNPSVCIHPKYKTTISPFPQGQHSPDYDSCETIKESSISYSRYFDLDKWFNTTYPFLITPKASKREKNAGCDDLNTVLHNGHQFNKQTGEPWVYSTKNNHPTVKPIKLMSYLIVLGSRENDIVLDPFAGSGTTLVASKMLNRQYIGCEMSKEYVEIIEARLSSVSSDKPIESNTFFS